MEQERADANARGEHDQQHQAHVRSGGAARRLPADRRGCEEGGFGQSALTGSAQNSGLIRSQ